MATITVTSKGQLKSIDSDLRVDQAIQLLQHSRSNFAQDLIRQAHSHRGLSHAQQNWVIFMAQESLDRARAQPRTQVGDFAQLTALFARAQQNGLTHPRIRLQLADGTPLVLDIVGAGANAGKLRLTNGLPKSDDRSRFYGFVSPDGTFSGSNPEVIALLQRFGQDPAGVAAQYGKSTGECCFCKLPLTNGEAGSVSVGYGPICSARWGLPWQPNGKDYEFGNGAPVVSEQPVAVGSTASPLTLELLLAGAASHQAGYDQLPAYIA